MFIHSLILLFKINPIFLKQAFDYYLHKIQFGYYHFFKTDM